MKVVKYLWFDEGLLGEPTIKCDCGHEFTVSSIDTDSDTTDIIECPSCHLKGKLIAKIRFLFDEVK